MIVIGLRFERSQGRRLRLLADRIRTGDLEGDITTFEQAALAAETGEPLQVHCNEPREAHLVAAGYVLHGVKRPAIEQLS